MDREDIKTLAIIVQEIAKIREESYDEDAADLATRECEDSKVDYEYFYKLSMIESAKKAVKLHAPELTCFIYDGNEYLSEFILYSIHLWNEVLEWADRVLAEEE